MKKKIFGIILTSLMIIQTSMLTFANAWCQDSVGDWFLKNGAWEKDQCGYNRKKNKTNLNLAEGCCYEEETLFDINFCSFCLC